MDEESGGGVVTITDIVDKTTREVDQHRTASAAYRSRDENVNTAFGELYTIIFSLCDYLKQADHEIKAMNNEIKVMNNEINKVKSIESKPSTAAPIVYTTDEDELERETNWIVKRMKKKRKATTSPEIIKDSTKPTEPTVQAKKKQVEKKEPSPPPINVVGIKDFQVVRNLIKSAINSEWKVTALNNNVWKINVTDSDAYRAVTGKLNAEKFQWYSFENKHDRPIKVVARGLHHSCPHEDITEDLRSKGFKILEAVNLLKREKQLNEEGSPMTVMRKLPLFILSFDKSEDVKNIYEIKSILNLKVRIEPLRKTSVHIPQCKKCQSFNHTQKYCQMEPRCVKCAGKHPTSECRIEKDSPPKCVNCKGDHPANYRGCEVARELQKLRDKKNSTTKNERVLPLTRRGSLARAKDIVYPATGGISYARVTAAKEPQGAKLSTDDMLAKVLKMLEDQASANNTLSIRLGKIEAKMSKKI